MGAGSRAGRSIEAAAFGELVIVSVPFTASTSFANPAVTLARAFTKYLCLHPARRCAGLLWLPSSEIVIDGGTIPTV